MPVVMHCVVTATVVQRIPTWLLRRCIRLPRRSVLTLLTLVTTTLGEFHDNFLKLCQDNVAAGGESLWEIPFSAGRGRVLYTWGVRHQVEDQYTYQPRGGVNGPLPTLFYDYEPEDIRRDITCVPYRWGQSDGPDHSE